MVEHRGLEPLTPTLPVWCAPNCANAPFLVRVTGLEPARRRHQILSLARLPVPPHPQIKNNINIISFFCGFVKQNRRFRYKKMPSGVCSRRLFILNCKGRCTLNRLLLDAAHPPFEYS